ncbi:MAG: nicotinamide mononucleotide transporter [Lentisphaeria bacterium]|nr:nicotinamide mononucleotide transporter [Lentisphaeria bacterium]
MQRVRGTGGGTGGKVPLMELLMDYCRRELRNWKSTEIFWMSSAALLVAAATLLSGGDNLLGITSAVTGIAYTLLAGKGKSSCYLFGAVNTLLYGYIAYRSRIYGDMLLNWGYYFPMQFVGLYLWSRNRTAATGEVIKRKLALKHELFLLTGIVLAWGIFGFLLKHFGAFSPFLDSATTVLSAAAMILGVLRCFEQWIAWTVVNTLSVILWLQVYFKQGNSLATLLMWSVFLICGVVFARQWLKEVKQ